MTTPCGRTLSLLLLVLLALTLAGCGEDTVTEVVPIAQPLPEREQARYRLLDREGRQVGTATLTIAPDGDDLRLGVAYEFSAQRTDIGSVVVRRQTLKPAREERTVVDGEKRYVTRAEYQGLEVSVTFDDGRRPVTRKASLTETAYDNLETLFLLRAMEHKLGVEVRYVNVVIDPLRGTISRTLATAHVIGREEVPLPSGPVQAWRVEFRSAGVTNTAWYRADDTRTLVRYAITRGPTLVLDSVLP
jgi:hypothetical protein